MSTINARMVIRSDIITLFAAGLLALTVSGSSLAGGADDKRLSVSHHVREGGRANAAQSTETTDEYDALQTSGSRGKAIVRGSGKPGSESPAAESVNYDFWFFDADVILFNDIDNDGYYHGIDLLFDADTIYSAAEVYAVVYLSLDYGPWNEYGVTEDFWLFGESGSDEYVLVTELMSGYPTGHYDLLIELYDAVDSSFLASLGPEDTSELEFLPLEDSNRDAPLPETRVVINHGGGGAADGWTIGMLLLLLFASAVIRIWRHRKDELVRIDSPVAYGPVRPGIRQPFHDSSR